MATRTVPPQPTQPTLREIFAEELRALLARRQIRQVALADMINAKIRPGEKPVDQKWVSRRLRGDVPLSTDDLDRIARALDASYSMLLPRLDSNQKPAVSWRPPASLATAA